MIDILFFGEILVEIMRDQPDIPLSETGCFHGPFPSGAPAICADAAARLGCKTAIIGGVGKDDFGSLVLSRLAHDGVDVSRVLQSTKYATGCAFVTYFKDGSRKFIFHMGNTPAVMAKAPQDPPDTKIMHIMGCSLMANPDFAQEILKTMQDVTAKGAKISFDPNIRKELLANRYIHAVIDEVMQNTSIFLPGVEELLQITNTSTVEDAINCCFTFPKIEIIALKNGSKGSRIITRNKTVEIKAYKVEQKDATGAGDCFDGAFLAGLIQGKSIEQSGQMGAAAGALNATALGPMEGNINTKNVWDMIKSD